MGVLVRGAKKVRALQQAIGGTPPKAGANSSRALLDRYMAQQFKQQSTKLQEMSGLSERWRKLLFREVAKDEARLKQLKRETQAQLEKRKNRKIEKPKRLAIEPRFITGSSFLFLAPPYDGAWQWKSDPDSQAQSNASTGTCDLDVGSIGDGSRAVSAAFFAWFFAPDDNPMQRFAAYMQYNDDWWDSASGYVAHNDLRTRLWFWGMTENRWVVQQEADPNWSDGVGWFENHGNDPNGDAGALSNDAFFPASRNNWYQAWVWSNASVYADSGFFGTAGSSLKFNSVVPFMVISG
jgi:hypothetical protein